MSLFRFLRFNADAHSNYIDIGMDSTGAFVIEQNDDPKLKINVDGTIEVFGKIRNVTTPTDGQDAATKAYIDNILLSFGISLGSVGIQGLLDAGYCPLELLSAGAPHAVSTIALITRRAKSEYSFLDIFFSIN